MPRISDLKHTYQGEWLAIAITHYEDDEPVEGELIAHSVDRSRVMRSFRLQRGRQIVITFADET